MIYRQIKNTHLMDIVLLNAELLYKQQQDRVKMCTNSVGVQGMKLKAK